MYPPHVVVPAALVDALADRYRLDRQLGAGGMATVYLAHDHRHGRRVAIKVLRPDLAETLGRERFLREILSFDGHITFHLAESFAVAGDTPTALRLLDRAVEHGFYPHDYIAKHCPFLAPLRGLDAFDRIVARAAERTAAFRRDV